MTDFSGVYRRINEGKAHAKNFQTLLGRFTNNGKNRATDKQVKALAIEANQHRIHDTNKQDRRGRWYNIVTGEMVKNESSKSRIPIWREEDKRKDRGWIININTGAKYRTRYIKGKHKGQLMKKDKWLYVNSKGQRKFIYPKNKKVSKGDKKKRR